LAKVYLELIEEKQSCLSLDRNIAIEVSLDRKIERQQPLPSALTSEDIAAHRAFIAEQLKGEVIWNDYLAEKAKAA
jgi:hypothetical protein